VSAIRRLLAGLLSSGKATLCYGRAPADHTKKGPAGRGARHQSKAHPLTSPVGPSPTPGDYPSRQATGAILCERINEPTRRGAPQRESDMRLFLSVSPYLAPLRRGAFLSAGMLVHAHEAASMRQCVCESHPTWMAPLLSDRGGSRFGRPMARIGGAPRGRLRPRCKFLPGPAAPASGPFFAGSLTWPRPTRPRAGGSIRPPAGVRVDPRPQCVKNPARK
jgi:hypothetical protein